MVAIVLEDDSNELEAGLRKQLEQGVDIVLIISGGLAPI
jgi:molybdopterin-biosynthesis enzyme MoeA-like protein